MLGEQGLDLSRVVRTVLRHLIMDALDAIQVRLRVALHEEYRGLGARVRLKGVRVQADYRE